MNRFHPERVAQLSNMGLNFVPDFQPGESGTQVPGALPRALLYQPFELKLGK